MRNKREYYVNRNKYIVITCIILFLAILFIAIPILSYTLLSDGGKEFEYSEEYLIKKGSELNNEQTESTSLCVYITGSQDKRQNEILLSMKQASLDITEMKSLKEISKEMAQRLDVVFLDLEVISDEDIKHIEALLAYNVSIVFTRFSKVIAQNEQVQEKLNEMLGIRQQDGYKSGKGIRLLEGFFIGGMKEIKDFPYIYKDVSLEGSCKVFLSGYVKDQESKEIKNEDLPKLIWRNVFQGAKIFAVNGPFMEKDYASGIARALLSQIYEDYLYPVINSIVIAADHFPYYGNFSSDQLMKYYSRDAEQLQRDILASDLISLSNFEKLTLTCYSSEDLNGEIQRKKVVDKQIKRFYEKMITNGGNEILTMSEKEAFESSVLTPPTLNQYYLGATDWLNFYTNLTAYGSIVMNFDMESIFIPENDAYDWVKASKSLKKTLSEYVIPYTDVLSSVTVSLAKIKAQVYQVSKPVIAYYGKTVLVTQENADTEYSYILRTRKQINSVENGTFQKIEENVYLIKQQAKQICIHLKEEKNRSYQKP